MIEEVGLVTAVSNGLAEVECERRSACSSCSASGACGTSLLERFLGRRRPVLAVSNPVGAEPGDRVVVGIREDAVLEAAFTAYFVPLLAMILGALGLDWLAGRLFPGVSDGLSVLGGLIGLGLGLRWLAGFSRRRRADARFQAVILRRMESASIRVGTEGLVCGDGPRSP